MRVGAQRWLQELRYEVQRYWSGIVLLGTEKKF